MPSHDKHQPGDLLIEHGGNCTVEIVVATVKPGPDRFEEDTIFTLWQHLQDEDIHKASWDMEHTTWGQRVRP